MCTEISSSNICSRDFETYHCDGGTNSNYEVHILGSYQAQSCCNDVPETSRIEVVNKGHVGRKLVLVLASTQPVAWYLDMEDGTEVQRVVLVSLRYVRIARPTWQRFTRKQRGAINYVSTFLFRYKKPHHWLQSIGQKEMLKRF